MLLSALAGETATIATLLYGAGLRLSEAIHLRVKDLDSDRRQIVIREANGNKDRISVLPECLVPTLSISLDSWRAEHALAMTRGAGRVPLPTALDRKYPTLETDWAWQWVFPAARPLMRSPADRLCGPVLSCTPAAESRRDRPPVATPTRVPSAVLAALYGGLLAWLWAGTCVVAARRSSVISVEPPDAMDSR